jgi:TonB family protein
MKSLIFISVTILFIGLTSFFIQDGTYSKKWFVSEHTADTGFSQNLRFEVHGRYSRPVKKENLNEAKLISDVIPGYPTSWITDYVSVEILATCDGKSMKALSPNEALTVEQKAILKKVDLGSDIFINVKYRSKNAVTDSIENNEIGLDLFQGGVYVKITVVQEIPEIEAEYAGGHQQMTNYLKENAINKISQTTPKHFQQGVVLFTVNEEGEIVNAKISKTSGDSKTDKLLVEAINKMPKWKPAENSKGIKVKQEFEFNVSTGGC